MIAIDLFAGVGGLSLGASRAGFDVKIAVEIDKFAIETHALNFPNTIHLKEDVGSLTGIGLLNKIGTESLDCLIGGPPCQGFSSIGKGQPGDTRNQLYIHFFRLVNEIKPKCFLAENVPGIMNEKYDHIRKEAFSIVEDDYFILKPIKVKASDYGAATIRTRIFFIGYRKDLGEDLLTELDFLPPDYISTVRVKDALYGSPTFIDSEWQNESQGWQKIKKGPKGYFYDRLWGMIPKDIGDKESLENLKKNIVSGFLGTRHSNDVLQRYRALTPGSMDRISKSTKLDLNGFCPTIRAGTGSDKGSFQAVRPIHPTEARVITPREAARLQGFPDWFRFHSTKWHSFRQIGNSVSPIVAEIMLKPLYNLCK